MMNASLAEVRYGTDFHAIRDSRTFPDTPRRPRMIDVRSAGTTAFTYLRSLPGHEHVINVAVEEIERADDGHWLITIGYQEPSGVILGAAHRRYKIFTINQHTGEVVSMKIREIR